MHEETRMKKQIKQIGNSKGITFSPEELRIYELKVGNVIDLEIYKPLHKLNSNDLIKQVKEELNSQEGKNGKAN